MRSASLISLLLAALLAAAACAPSAPPVAPLPPEQREAVGAYLQKVAEINRQGSTPRLRLRWWIVEVPTTLWEGRGPSLRSLTGEVAQYAHDVETLAKDVRALSSVPPAAQEANEALLASYEATVEMIEVYSRVIGEYRAREVDGAPRPPRSEREPTLAAARLAASQATDRAEQELAGLLARYRASEGKA